MTHAAMTPPEILEEASLREDVQTPGKTPLALRIFGVLSLVGGAALIPTIIGAIIWIGLAFHTHALADVSTVTRVLLVILVTLSTLDVVLLLVLGIRLIRGKRRGARQTAETSIITLIGLILCDLMLFGPGPLIILYIVAGGVLIAMLTYIDPSLTQERKLQHRLRDMDVREQAEDGTLGKDTTGKGYIALDFFNLFWIFVIACFIGDIVETVYHIVVVDPGVFQNRTGMLWGPFSPIYGFGAVLMTLALNRFYKANIWLVFLVSAVIGGAFEYLVSWFLQFAFGVVAWDYSGTFLNIDGRTNFMFMCMWGVLGVFWIKGVLPWALKLVNLIPWKWRYTVTAIAAAFMFVDGAMTLITLDCWYGRMAGGEAQSALEQFCASHYNNEWMAEHFQSMTIDPSLSTRTG